MESDLSLLDQPLDGNSGTLVGSLHVDGFVLGREGRDTPGRVGGQEHGR